MENIKDTKLASDSETAKGGELDSVIMQMFKAGAHFGHPKSKWNPKMAQYIYSAKNGIHIIDLVRTKEKLDIALAFMKSLAAREKQIVFIGTKRQAKDIIEDLARDLKMPYVSSRWVGGTFTNFKVISKRIAKLDELKEIIEKTEESGYTKQEIGNFSKEAERIEEKLGGLKTMKELPGAVFVFDAGEDKLAVKEARQMNIPVIALADTNIDPSQVDYPIPCNDDAIAVIKLIAEIIKKELAK